jgi:RNA polymerase sigma-70 factor (ECF subfamily)
MPRPSGMSRGLERWNAALAGFAGRVGATLEQLFAGPYQPAFAGSIGAMAVSVPMGGPIARTEAADPAALLPGLAPPRLLRRTRRETPVADDPEQAEVVALVRSAQNGNAEAFGRLYDRYHELVHRYVYYRVASLQLAEDVTSETFLRAFRRLNTFSWQGRDFGAWLVTIARNIVADHFKSSRYRLEVTTAEMLDSDRVEESPEHTVLKSFTNVALVEAVRQLGPEQQECIVLRFLQGLTVAETARIMGRNEGAVKALQYRAVRALGRLLPDELR